MPSRRDRPPTWRELVVRVAITHVPHARGVWRRSGDQATGWFSYGPPGRIVAAPPDVDLSFVYRRGSGSRVEGGNFLYVDDGETSYLREPDGTVISAPSGRIRLGAGPQKLLLAEIDTRLGRRHRSEPTVTEVTRLGRRAWLAEADHGRFWVDDASGVLLRSERRQRGAGHAEFLELDLDSPVTDDETSFDGPHTPLPLPPEPSRTGPVPRPKVVAPTLSWWPRGARPELLDGDAATGRLLAAVRLAWPDQVFLGRAPLSGLDPEVRGEVQWRWTTPEWRFALSAAAPSALSEIELRTLALELDA